MSDDDIDIYDDPNFAATGIDRKVLLIVLAGLAGLAVTLAVLQARMKRPVPTTLGAIPEGSSWEASLQHVCDTFDFRLAGIDQRLDSLAAEKVQAQAATFSAPPTTLVNAEGGQQDVERVPPVIEVGPMADSPPLAATSLPPE